MRDMFNKIVAGLFDIVLGLLSLFLVFNGVTMYQYTSGVVQSTEFSLLITIANELSLIIIWLALYAMRELSEKWKKLSV